MRRLVRIALVLWLARWAVQELAAYAGRHWLPTRTGDGALPSDTPKQGV